MKYQNIPYIFKYLTRFIYHPDKWVEGDQPEPASLVPFKLGQTIKAGDKLKFDLSLDTSVIDNFLNNLDYDLESNTIRLLLRTAQGECLLTAYNGEPFGFDSRFLIKDVEEFSPETLYYSTKDIVDPSTGITIQKGGFLDLLSALK